MGGIAYGGEASTTEGWAGLDDEEEPVLVTRRDGIDGP
jgi:hypothetical protein